MPLLRQEAFVKKPLPDDLCADDEVFFCRLTGEVFQHYDEFFKRTILLNSMVWTCASTGNTGLTFEEALTSEKRGSGEKRDLISIGEDGSVGSDPAFIDEPGSEECDQFETAAALLVTFTTRGFMSDLITDLSDYFKEHYFRGELVELMCDGKRRVGRIMKISHTQPSTEPDDNADEDTGKHYRYEIKVQKAKNVSITVEADREAILRRKVPISKNRCKAFVKEHCDITDSASYKLKDEVIERLNINDTLWDDLFVGPRPKFPASPLTRRSLSLPLLIPKDLGQVSQADLTAIEQRKQILEQMSADLSKFHLTCDTNVILSSDHSAAELAISALREAVKKARDEEKERQKEEKRKLAEWKKPRDDQDCEDHSPLPDLRPLRLPAGLNSGQFGRCLSLVEFFACFLDQLQGQQLFGDADLCGQFYQRMTSRNVNFDDNAFLQVLLSLLATIFSLAKEEEDEEMLDEVAKKPKAEPAINTDSPEEAESQPAVEAEKPSHLNESSAWHDAVKCTFGVSVSNLPLNRRTISEILRLFLLTSGRHSESPSLSRLRAQNRGGYKFSDDCAFALRLARPDLIDHLAHRSVVALSFDDRLEVLSVLQDQLLSYPAFRMPLQQRLERLASCKQEWRQWGSLEQRWEREAAQAVDVIQQNDDPAAAPAKTSETLALLKRYFDGGESKRHKLKLMLLEGVDWTQLASCQEIDEARKVQKAFVLQEQTALRREIFKLRARCGMNHLGRDRCYRNYWLITSCNAILVERDWAAENLAPSQCPSKQTPLERTTDRSCSSESLVVCTAQGLQCPLHGAEAQTPGWYIITDAETLDLLISSLNPRGFRESDLLENLKFYQSFLQVGAEENFTLYSEDGLFLEPAADFDEQLAPEHYAVEMRARLLDLEQQLSTKNLAFDQDARLLWRNALENSAAEEGESDEQVLKLMALSLHQLALALNSKFLKFPFRSSKSSRKSSVLDRWCELLLNDVFSWSRLFLFLDTFEHSIAWHKASMIKPSVKHGAAKVQRSCAAAGQQDRISRAGRTVKKPVSFDNTHGHTKRSLDSP